MDQQELKNWRDFCEGTNSYPPEHFSRIFMEMFLHPPSEKDRDDVRTVLSYVPNSFRTLDKMLRLDGRADDKSDPEITGLVIRDLKEMRRIIDNPEILTAMDLGVSEIIVDETRFRQAFESPLNREFLQAIADYFIKEMFRQPNNEKISALNEAFYGLASDLHLQYALTADLLGSDVNCDNYFELYLIGVNYALDTNGALVINYRK
jgi:hypothetical protein